jgi:hypothetical protein
MRDQPRGRERKRNRKEFREISQDQENGQSEIPKGRATSERRRKAKVKAAANALANS